MENSNKMELRRKTREFLNNKDYMGLAFWAIERDMSGELLIMDLEEYEKDNGRIQL
tara:strand:+ start:266 stop:433 length:168 start_codon:yes stop_codon:yes gene_type:complete